MPGPRQTGPRTDEQRADPRSRVDACHPRLLPQASRGPRGAAATRPVRHRRGWPVLTAEATPRLDTERVDDDASTASSSRRTTWTWDEIHALPASTYTGDIHCVTTWSKFDVTFRGVSVDALLAQAAAAPRRPVRDGALDDRLHHQPPARGRHRRARPGWSGTTAAGRCHGEHGGPVRLLVPHLYFWKSAKWVTRLELMAEDRPGFWEQQRLPRPRRPVARAALPGRLTATHGRPSTRSRPRRPPGRPDGSSRRSCRRRPRSGCGCTWRTGSGTGRASTT